MPVDTKAVYFYKNGQYYKGEAIITDDALSATSENPVQNKVVYTAINQTKLTTSTVSDGTVTKVIGFDSNGNIVKETSYSPTFASEAEVRALFGN